MRVLGRIRDRVYLLLPPNIGRYVMPFLTVAVSVILVLLIIQTVANRTFSEQMRDAQIEACENSPVRWILVESLKSELLAVDDPRIHTLFPNVSQAFAEQLIREGNREKRKQINRLRGIDCEARYP